jgi:hypothetical protein
VGNAPIIVDQIWVWNHAQIWGRAVELTHTRYSDLMTARAGPDPTAPGLWAYPLDSYVELGLWAFSMRMLIRVARAAKSLGLPAADAAVAAFEAAVNVEELTYFRDVLEHADEYAAGVGRHKVRGTNVDFDGWTAAAAKLYADLHEAIRPQQ